MVDSWKVIRGVKYVDISNMPSAYFTGVRVNDTTMPPTFGDITDAQTRQMIFDSGLEVFTYYAYKGVDTSAKNFDASLIFGTYNGVALSGRMYMTFAKTKDDVISVTTLFSNSYDDKTGTKQQTLSSIPNNGATEMVFKIVPCYLNTNYGGYKKELYGYALITRSFREGETGYGYGSMGDFCLGAIINMGGSNNYGWHGISVNGKVNVGDGARNENDEADNDGGYGDKFGSKDNVTIPNKPTLTLHNSGVRTYVLDTQQMHDFTEWLWTSDWQDNIKKIRSNPMENIINIGLIDTSIPSSASSIIVGNVSTTIQAGETEGFLDIECGSITIPEYYGNYADFEPFSNYKIYLPKIGFVNLPTDEIINNTITITYRIELSTGEGICIIEIYNTRDHFKYIYNILPCQCVSTLPLTASDNTQRITSTINMVQGIAGGILHGNPTSIAESSINGALNVALSKNPTEIYGKVGNMGALMSNKRPFVIGTCTNIVVPNEYGKNNGYLTYKTFQINSLSGYCKALNYHAEFEAPKDCLVEIENILNNGFYI